MAFAILPLSPALLSSPESFSSPEVKSRSESKEMDVSTTEVCLPRDDNVEVCSLRDGAGDSEAAGWALSSVKISFSSNCHIPNIMKTFELKRTVSPCCRVTTLLGSSGDSLSFGCCGPSITTSPTSPMNEIVTLTVSREQQCTHIGSIKSNTTMFWRDVLIVFAKTQSAGGVPVNVNRGLEAVYLPAKTSGLFPK